MFLENPTLSVYLTAGSKFWKGRENLVYLTVGSKVWKGSENQSTLKPDPRSGKEGKILNDLT